MGHRHDDGGKAGYMEFQEHDNITAVAEDDPLSWQMEGIDVSAGLEYAGQDAELYREILSDYADYIEEHAETIERAVAEKDFETYTIEVHSLKSTSRTIGAMELSYMARELEKNGKNREWEPILEKTAGLLAVYRGLYAVIMPYHIHAESGTQKKPVEYGEVHGLLSDLCASLEEYDSIWAEKTVSVLSGYDFTDTHAGYMERLVAALGKFDYETCRTVVLQWIGELQQRT